MEELYNRLVRLLNQDMFANSPTQSRVVAYSIHQRVH